MGIGQTFSSSSMGIKRPESSARSRTSSSPLESPVRSITSLGAWFSLSSPVTSTAVNTAGSNGEEVIGGVAYNNPDAAETTDPLLLAS